MSTTPPTPPPGIPPGGEGPPEGPASAVGGGTHAPSDTMTRYDAEKDAYRRGFDRGQARARPAVVSAAR